MGIVKASFYIYIYNLQVEWIMFGFIQNFCILMQLVINGRSEVNLIPVFSTLMITYVGLDHFVLVYCDFIKKLFVLLLFPAFAELLDNALDEVSFLYWLLLCCETCNF
jgi:hypothetical protein